MPEDILNVYCKQAEGEKLYGFWGHIGIRPSLSDEFLWLPITGKTRDMIYDAIGQDRMVVPCMNNKLLLINMDNVDKIVLLDDACDEPGNCNWDPDVNCGEIPLVLYESLEDYFYYTDSKGELPEDIISQNLRKCLDAYVANLDADIDEIMTSLDAVVITYSNGKKEITDIDFSYSESIVGEISSIYEFDDFSFTERYLSYRTYNGEEIFLNFECVAFIEVPLLKVEDAICGAQDEMIDE